MDNCYNCGFDVENRVPEPDCTCKTGFYEVFDSNGVGLEKCELCPHPSIECFSTS